MSRASLSVMLPGPKWGMLPGPVRMASTICRGGQVQARGVGPVHQRVTGAGDGVAGRAVEGEQGVALSRSALLGVDHGTRAPSPGVRDCTKAAISRVWRRSNRGGLRVACSLESASGMRPVDTQKSTVPEPEALQVRAPGRCPSASARGSSSSWQLNRAWPGAMKELGRL